MNGKTTRRISIFVKLAPKMPDEFPPDNDSEPLMREHEEDCSDPVVPIRRSGTHKHPSEQYGDHRVHFLK